MTTKSLSPSKIEKLKEVFGAALRKADPPDAEAQDLIENHWVELEPELMAAFTGAVNKVLARIRRIVALVITSTKQYVLPNGWNWEPESVLAIEPGEYKLSFEEFLREGEESVDGEEMLSRAAADGIDGSIQHALWLLENQNYIPKEFRGKKYLVFPKAVALDSDRSRIVADLRWDGRRWYLHWGWLARAFDRDDLVVRARKSK